MFFIVGISPVNKVIGPLDEEPCSRCNNTKHWLLSKSSSFISLFFIPIIPLGSKYHKFCPICNQAQQLSRDEFHTLEPLAKLNKRAIDEDMSESEYQQFRNNL